MYKMGNVVSIVKGSYFNGEFREKRSMPDGSAHCEKQFLEVMCIFV